MHDWAPKHSALLAAVAFPSTLPLRLLCHILPFTLSFFLSFCSASPQACIERGVEGAPEWTRRALSHTLSLTDSSSSSGTPDLADAPPPPPDDARAPTAGFMAGASSAVAAVAEAGAGPGACAVAVALSAFGLQLAPEVRPVCFAPWGRAWMLWNARKRPGIVLTRQCSGSLQSATAPGA